MEVLAAALELLAQQLLVAQGIRQTLHRPKEVMVVIAMEIEVVVGAVAQAQQEAITLEYQGEMAAMERHLL
jgi:hypothetical protein